MTDNITLRRAVGKTIRKALTRRERYLFPTEQAALDALTAALAEPETVAVDLGKEGSDKTVISFFTLPIAAKPEPATREQVFAAYDRNDAIGFWNYCDAWREAERFHGIGGSK